MARRQASATSLKFSPCGRWLAARQTNLYVCRRKSELHACSHSPWLGRDLDNPDTTLLYDLDTISSSPEEEDTPPRWLVGSTAIPEVPAATDYIKEVAFNRSGSLLASPHGNGVGIYSTLDPKQHALMADQTTAAVLTTAFSPTTDTIAMGSFNGQVSFLNYR